jgi:hypothetical protein
MDNKEKWDQSVMKEKLYTIEVGEQVWECV